MIKSAAGIYRDIVSMTPVARLSAELLEKVWRNVTEQFSKIGFDVSVRMVDGHSSNLKFFETKLLKDFPDNTYSVPNPWMLGCLIFLLFDTVHLFKNVYNSWLKRKVFISPTFDKNEPKGIITADFLHKELYDIELGKYPKMAHKLTKKILQPKSIERKTNVKLADAAFHKSTINALKYYGENGFQHFIETASFCKIIRDWFNTMNVKSTDYG